MRLLGLHEPRAEGAVADRGESVKTSNALPHQGVTIDSEWITELFHQWLQRVKPGGKVFSISKQQVEHRVRKAMFALGLDEEDAILHRLRHTAAANDVADGVRTLEEARRRGRWLHLSSLQRYTKTAHLLACLSKLPQEARRYGESFMGSPRSYICPPPVGGVAFDAPLV